jgi:hypothetical protein
MGGRRDQHPVADPLLDGDMTGTEARKTAHQIRDRDHILEVDYLLDGVATPNSKGTEAHDTTHQIRDPGQHPGADHLLDVDETGPALTAWSSQTPSVDLPPAHLQRKGQRANRKTPSDT